ncbi:MAG TPA: helix-turn-helix transcriptional regulator [Candidatus Angelobacter sp.]|jgi:transcriptional regulator with XRE-family HTH domain|nr:helix-turn-helix transcriptional regulator [Candidatus Angelobacter sp.]
MKQLQISVGQKIKELRIEAGLSQEAFADKVQIHRSHMGEIERGEVDIRISQLMRVAEELGIKVSKLVQGIA